MQMRKANREQGLMVKITSYPKSASGITAFITGKPPKILHCLEGFFNLFPINSVATRFFFGCHCLMWFNGRLAN